MNKYINMVHITYSACPSAIIIHVQVIIARPPLNNDQHWTTINQFAKILTIHVRQAVH